jgi:excisionase family DNA binding protein
MVTTAMINFKSNGPDSTLAVTLTIDQLRALVREEIQAAVANVDSPTLLPPEELAAKLNVPVSWVYEQSRQGNIPTHRIGRYIRFDLREVIRGRLPQRSERS